MPAEMPRPVIRASTLVSNQQNLHQRRQHMPYAGRRTLLLHSTGPIPGYVLQHGCQRPVKFQSLLPLARDESSDLIIPVQAACHDAPCQGWQLHSLQLMHHNKCLCTCCCSCTLVHQDCSCAFCLGVLCLAGSCAKQSYQAVVASKDVNVTCDNGLILQDHTGGWRCVSMPDTSPCSMGFSSSEEMQGGIGTRCKQVGCT